MAGRKPQVKTSQSAGRKRRVISEMTPSLKQDRALKLYPVPMLRTSERSALKRCEFLWDLTYNRRVKPITDAPALRFGSLIHGALAAYYIPGIKRGEHPALAFERLYEADQKRNREIFGMKVDEDEKWVNAAELGPAMLNNYVDEYGADDRWEVLVTEWPFRCLVYDPRTYDPNYPPEAQQGAKPWFYYVGVIDGVWRDRKDKTTWIPDHKSTAGLGDSKLKYLQVDDQAGAYWSWGVEALIEYELLRKNERLNGMLYNFLRKALPDERPSKFVNGRRLYLNQDGSVSKKQPSPYFSRQPIFRDAYDHAEAMRRATVDFERITMFREGRLEMTKSPGMFTCPMCPVRDACELHETGGDWEQFMAKTMKAWDPYAEHEIYDGR